MIETPFPFFIPEFIPHEHTLIGHHSEIKSAGECIRERTHKVVDEGNLYYGLDLFEGDRKCGLARRNR